MVECLKKISELIDLIDLEIINREEVSEND